MTMIITY